MQEHSRAQIPTQWPRAARRVGGLTLLATSLLLAPHERAAEARKKTKPTPDLTVVIAGRVFEQPERLGAVALGLRALQAEQPNPLSQRGFAVLEPLIDHATRRGGGCVAMTPQAALSAIEGVFCAGGSLEPTAPTIPGLDPPDLSWRNDHDRSGGATWDGMVEREKQLARDFDRAWEDYDSVVFGDGTTNDGTEMTPAEALDNVHDAMEKLAEHRKKMKDYKDAKAGKPGQDEYPDPRGDGLPAIPEGCEDTLLASLPPAPSKTDPSPLDADGMYVACVLDGDLANLLQKCTTDMAANPGSEGGSLCDTIGIDAGSLLHTPFLTRNDLRIDPVPDFALERLDLGVMKAAAKAVEATDPG